MGIDKWVFIFGAPRSGTTWLQLLLSQHPNVATCPESHLVDGYLARLDGRVQWEQAKNMTGLTSILSNDELRELLAEFAESVLERISSRSDGSARVFVEKTPQHARHPTLLQQYLPDAHFLHMIRDPRDVVASLLAASRTWGSEWAPKGPVKAAIMWAEHVRNGRRLYGSGDRYRELRFEDLKEDPEKELAGLHEWLRLPTSSAVRREAVKACELDRLRQEPEEFEALPEKVRRNADRFFRKGEAGGSELSPSARRAVEQVAREEMEQLGYEPREEIGPLGSVRVLVSRFLRRTADAVGYRLSSMAERL